MSSVNVAVALATAVCVGVLCFVDNEPIHQSASFLRGIVSGQSVASIVTEYNDEEDEDDDDQYPPFEEVWYNATTHRRLQESGERPLIYTYFEPPQVYNPNDDSMDLLENWRKAWYDMGWNPMILSSQQAQELRNFQELMELITEPNLVTPESIRNYKRWMAMAAVGGGWMCDFNTWPLNYFLRHGRELPYDGELTVYSGTNPKLVSGTAQEYMRMVAQIGEMAEKMITHQKFLNENYPESFKKIVPWNDAAALAELKKKVSTDMFKTRMDVVEKGKVRNKDGEFDCDNSEGKRAVFWQQLMPNGQDTRAAVARKWLNSWRAACEVGQVPEMM